MSDPFPGATFVRLRAGESLLLERVFIARSFWVRGLGLMFRKRVPAGFGQGLVFPNCRELHTCNMRFALDIFFLDAEGQLLEERRGIKPWRAVRGPAGTRHALETAAGAIPAQALAGPLRWEDFLTETSRD